METRTQRRRLRKAGVTLGIATGLVIGAMGGSAFAGGSNQCSHYYQTCESNGGSYGYTGHYVSSHSEYHDFSTSPYGGRNDRP